MILFVVIGKLEFVKGEFILLNISVKLELSFEPSIFIVLTTFLGERSPAHIRTNLIFFELFGPKLTSNKAGFVFLFSIRKLFRLLDIILLKPPFISVLGNKFPVIDEF